MSRSEAAALRLIASSDFVVLRGRLEHDRDRYLRGLTQVNGFPEQVRLEGAWYPGPSGTGLEIEVNKEAVAKPFEFYEKPHLRRSDGSQTNW